MDFFHVRSFGHIEIWSNQTMLKYTASANSSFIADYAVFDDDATKKKKRKYAQFAIRNALGWLAETYPSSITTPFITTLFDIRVFGFTVQFGPRIQFFNDVFSEMVVFSATAQSVICVDLMLLAGDTSSGAERSNSCGHKVNI